MTTEADVAEARAIHVKLVATAVLVDRLDRDLSRGATSPRATLDMLRLVHATIATLDAELGMVRARAAGRVC